MQKQVELPSAPSRLIPDTTLWMGHPLSPHPHPEKPVPFLGDSISESLQKASFLSRGLARRAPPFGLTEKHRGRAQAPPGEGLPSHPCQRRFVHDGISRWPGRQQSGQPQCFFPVGCLAPFLLEMALGDTTMSPQGPLCTLRMVPLSRERPSDPEHVWSWHQQRRAGKLQCQNTNPGVRPRRPRSQPPCHSARQLAGQASVLF